MLETVIDFLCGIAGMLPFECMKLRFMQEAFLGVLLTAPLAAAAGIQVVNFRMSFFSDAIGHSAFAGVGGCPFVPGAAGNISTEDLLHMCGEMGVETGIDLDQALEISRMVVGMVGHPTDSYLLRAGKSSDLIRELPTGQGKNPKAAEKS